MLSTKLNLLLLITFVYCSHVDAWIQGRNCERLNKFGLRSSSEDLNFQKFQLQLESIFFEDTVNLKDETTLHIGGLYESLSPLPVHDWADSEVYFDDGDWIDLSSCRDEECEVSHSDALDH